MIIKIFSILLLNLYLYEFNVKAQGFTFNLMNSIQIKCLYKLINFETLKGIDTNFCNTATISKII